MVYTAQTYFTPEEVKRMEELVAINEELKKLEAKKKVLVDDIKTYMTNNKIDKVDVNGSTLSLVTYERRTVTKATKDEFIANLVALGKKHLVNYSIEPDLDTIFTEVDSGQLDGNMVNQYVKVTPALTLRCN